ncbi:SAV_2336 N-terminal domain-related protein [Kitasatospora sp. NPDC059673]|uniref:SAV_2336 N-terminal domain-related protein n=1 Tax=Kitasatospora sp. NPDC059673 TaxID=3346901 RepID=UPI00368256C6
MRDHTAELVAKLTALLPPDTDGAAVADALWLAAGLAPDGPPVHLSDPSVPRSFSVSHPAAPAASAAVEAPPEEPEHRPATPLYEPPTGDPAAPRVEVAAARALPHALDAGRALRPFKRRYPHGPRRTVDLDATVSAYTRTGELLPVLSPTPERWFEVVVLVERSPTMEIWQDTLDEFTTLLTGLGAFRRVRRLHLDLDPHPTVTDTHGRPVPPARLPQQRRLLLVLTDCAGPHWRTPAIWQLLHTWGAHGPVALLNPLPGRLRHRTALDLPAVRVRHRRPDARNTELAHAVPLMLTATFGPEAGWVPLPTPSLTPHSLRRWADAMMRGTPAGHDAVLVPATGTLTSPFADDDPTDADDPARRAAAFLHTATPAARRLAALCSPFSRLSLPLLRLVRQEAVPEADTDDLAEVLTAGLLDTRTPAALTFHPEARAALTPHLTRHDAWTVHAALTHHLATHHPRPGHAFSAIAPEHLDELPADLQPFATATADLLTLLAPARRRAPRGRPATPAPPRFPDPARSAAVLIGIPGPAERDSPENLRTSLDELKSVLTSPMSWNLPPERCHVLLGASTPEQVQVLLAAADLGAEDALLVYVQGDFPEAVSDDGPPGGVRQAISDLLDNRPAATTVLMMDGNDATQLARPIERRLPRLAGAVAILSAERQGADDDFSLARSLAKDAEEGIPGGPDVIGLDTLLRLPRRRPSGSSASFRLSAHGPVEVPAILRNRQALQYSRAEVRMDFLGLRAELEARGIQVSDEIAPILLALVSFSHSYAQQVASGEVREADVRDALADFLGPALVLASDPDGGPDLSCRRREGGPGVPFELLVASQADPTLPASVGPLVNHPLRIQMLVGRFENPMGPLVFRHKEQNVHVVALFVPAPGSDNNRAAGRVTATADVLVLPDHEGQGPLSDAGLRQLAEIRAQVRAATDPEHPAAFRVEELATLVDNLRRRRAELAGRQLCLAVGHAPFDSAVVGKGTAAMSRLWNGLDALPWALGAPGQGLAVLLTDEVHQEMRPGSQGTTVLEYVPFRPTGESGDVQAWFGMLGSTGAALITRLRPTADPSSPQSVGYSHTRLCRQLRDLGVRPGGVLFVQVSERAIRAVLPEQLMAALHEVLGPDGTVVMSAATPENSLNSAYTKGALAGLTPDAQEVYRSYMPPFDPLVTPVSASAGSLAEWLRRDQASNSVRSAHPQHSFVASGRWAQYLMADHRLDSPHGEHSPLLKLHQSRAQALLLGVPVNECLAWNLAASRIPNPPMVTESCVVKSSAGTGREWVTFTTVAAPELDAPELRERLEAQLPLRRGVLADEAAVLAPVEEGVELVAAWLADTRH